MRLLAATAFLSLSIGACGAQERAATEVRPPENFGDVFMKVFRASENGFNSIKGSPISGPNEPNSFKRANGATSQRFRWIPTVVLPGSKKDSCVILREETTGTNGRRRFPVNPSYSCELIYDGAQVLPIIQTALGPGWSIDSKPYDGDVFTQQVFFRQTPTETYPPVTLAYMKNGHCAVVISQSLGSR
jgi:hypothetical protein